MNPPAEQAASQQRTSVPAGRPWVYDRAELSRGAGGYTHAVGWLPCGLQ